MLIDSEIWKSLVTLFYNNYAFSFSFLIYFRLWEVFKLNQKREFRYRQVYTLIILCFLYCLSYQLGVIRWFIMGFNYYIPVFDERLWTAIECFTQVIHFIFLTIIKKILLSRLPECLEPYNPK